MLLWCAGCISCTIWKNPPKGWAGATGGEQLERQFWKEVSQQHWSAVHRHLATNFTLSTPAGFFGPDEAIAHWKQLELADYSLGNFKIEPNGADVVVAYTLTLRGTKGGQPVASDPAYVISVWQEIGTRWLLIAQSTHPASPEP
jgi:Domain of unknown function (DUF4440)